VYGCFLNKTSLAGGDGDGTSYSLFTAVSAKVLTGVTVFAGAIGVSVLLCRRRRAASRKQDKVKYTPVNTRGDLP
jgi:hypothetical protein